MIETRCLKNAVIFIQTVLSFVLSRTFITYDKIRKVATGQGDVYTIGCLLEYNYFKNYYKMIAIDLS